MKNIFKSLNVSLTKKNKSFLLEVKNVKDKSNKLLFDSLQLDTLDLLTTQTKCSKQNTCSAEFNADSVVLLKTLVNKLSYNDLVFLFLSLKNQIDFLYKKHYGILYFNINDIIAIKKNESYIFLFLNSSNLYPINNDFLMVTQSFNKKNTNNFIPPELYGFNSIPFEVHYKVSFFSLSLLVSFVIEGKNIDIFDSDWSINDFVKICEPIDNTKLFWALLRCQKINPENRFLLWI